MKLKVEYTISVEVDEDKTPEVETELNGLVKKFDATATVEETDCEELEDDEAED